jgi:hypothetical protein
MSRSGEGMTDGGRSFAGPGGGKPLDAPSSGGSRALSAILPLCWTAQGDVRYIVPLGCGAAPARALRMHTGERMNLIVITFAFVLLIGCPTAVWAQEAERIRASVKDGQRVVVTDDQGREFAGKIAEIGADTLRLLVGTQPTAVRFASIVRIDRPHDTLANGALIGLGVGAAFGLTAVALEDARECNPAAFFDCSDPSLAGYVIIPLMTGGLGSAIGVGIDALIRRDRTIYRRGDHVRTTLRPIAGHGVRGVVAAVSW